MFCLCKSSNPQLLLEKVGGLSLLHRALLTLQAAGIREASFPSPLKNEIEKLALRDARITEIKIAYDWVHSNAAYLEWNLDWVIWPNLFSEFVSQLNQTNKVLMLGEEEAGLRYDSLSASTNYTPHRSSNPVWPLMKVTRRDEISPLLKTFYKALKKPTDGFVSQHLNRPVSIFCSSILVRFGVSPSFMTTFCILLTVFAALLALSANPWHLAIAGLLFHIASTLDGCDGEIARLTFSGTEFGAWYDTLGDNGRYGFFFACLGVRAFQSTGNSFYIWALAVFVPLMIYFVWLNARYLVATKSGGTFLVMANKVVKEGKASKSLWDKIVTPLQPFTKLDVQAFVVMLMCFAGYSNIMFCFSLVGIFFMTLSTVRSVEREEEKLGEKLTNHWAFFFLLMGSLVLVFLFREIPFTEIAQSLRNLGWSVLWVFALAPVWFFLNALTLKVLTRGQVGIAALFYNHLVGESYNNILPLAGLAGEPFKLKHLSGFLDMPRALKVVVHDKLLNAQAGILLIFVSGFISYSFLELSAVWKTGILLATLVLTIVFVFFVFLTLSEKPRLWTQKVLKNFGYKKELKSEKLDWHIFVPAFLFRFLGRLIGVLEVALLMYLLHLPLDLAKICFLAFMLSASGLIFFMIPQGIGVNEAGLTAAFRILGWSTSDALALGLLRRARIVGWALMGLLLHMCGGLSAFRQRSSPHTSVSKI